MRIIILFLSVLASPVFASEPFTSTINLAVEVVYYQEVERAMKYVPTGKTKSQLQRAAQNKSNQLFREAARLYKIPVFRIKIAWGLLRDVSAGQASSCSEPLYFISMNEILFLYNFDASINEHIPHEVAHIVTCFVHPEISKTENFNSHGSEWQAIAKSLGSTGKQYHQLDTTPLAIYFVRLELLDATDQEKINSLQHELNNLINLLNLYKLGKKKT